MQQYVGFFCSTAAASDVIVVSVSRRVLMYVRYSRKRKIVFDFLVDDFVDEYKQSIYE